MNIDWIRRTCLALPYTSEDIKWENNLVFCVDGKMFAITNLEPDATWLSFKCSPENFAELTEQPGVRPAPYLARAQWIALDRPHALPLREVKALLAEAHQIIFRRLPKKRQRELRGE